MNLNNQYQTCPGFMNDERLFTEWMPNDLNLKNKMNLLGIKDNDDFRKQVGTDISNFVFNGGISNCQIPNINSGEAIHKIFEENMNNIIKQKNTIINSAYEYDTISLK